MGDLTTPQVEALTGGVNPFARGTWDGLIRSLDGAPNDDDFDPEHVDKVIAVYESGDQYDGEVAGLVLMEDGRFVAWETVYGPTGHGFSEDAYGGDADIFVAYSFEKILRFAFSDEGRRKLDFEDPPNTFGVQGHDPIWTPYDNIEGKRAILCQQCDESWPCTDLRVHAAADTVALRRELNEN